MSSSLQSLYENLIIYYTKIKQELTSQSFDYQKFLQNLQDEKLCVLAEKLCLSKILVPFQRSMLMR